MGQRCIEYRLLSICSRKLGVRWLLKDSHIRVITLQEAVLLVVKEEVGKVESLTLMKYKSRRG